MNELAEEFMAWTLALERTQDEAFLAELLIDEALECLARREKGHVYQEWDAKCERWRRRRLNPAHRRVWSPSEVRRAAELVVEFQNLDHWTHGNDRPVRDLTALRFCPRLTKFMVAPTELATLEGLWKAPALEDLWLQDDRLEDFGPLRQCLALRKVHLWLQFPWPDLRALAELPELEEATLHMNLAALEGVGPLPKVKKVLFSGWGHGRAPAKSCSALPEMPALREARISPLASLRGAEKYAVLEEVTFEGPYKSIKPLAALGEVRELVLGGNQYADISPLARMRRLAVLRLAREFPLDYTPLLESESLRVLERCDDKPLTPEQAGINAALGGWDHECVLAEPRLLPRPVYRFIQHGENPPPGFEARTGTRATPAPVQVLKAEGKWLAARLDRVMTRSFGADWGETYSMDHDAQRGSVDVTIHDIEVADELSKVIDLLRRELAWLRDAWVIDLTLDPRSQWQRNPEAWKDDVAEDLEEKIQEAHDAAARRRDYLAYLDRLRTFRERQEQGEEPLPEEFAAPPEPKEPEAEGNLAEPEESAMDAWEAEHHPRWHDYYVVLDVCEEGVWVPLGFRSKAERLLGRPVEKFPGWTEEDEKEN